MGLSPTGLYVVRELGRAGIPLLGVTSSLQAGARSRCLNFGPRVIIEPDECKRLEMLCSAFPAQDAKAVLIPTSDQDLDFILRHHAELESRFVFQPSYLDGVAESLMTKASLYEQCERLGISFPRSWRAGREEVIKFALDLTYPCLVKPSRIDVVKTQMAGRKLWTANDQGEFKRIAASLPEGETEWIIQELVPGPESMISLYAAYFDADCTPHQATTCRKLRQYPPGFGSASLVRTLPDEETREISERLLTAVRYRGIAATEFKRDPRDGKLKLIEVNPRPSLWFSITTAADKQLSLAAYNDLLGLPMPPEVPQVDGVEWRYWAKDLYSAVFYRLQRNFHLPPPDLESLLPPKRRVSTVFQADDPLPSLVEGYNFVRKGMDRLLGSRIRRG